MGKMTFTSSNRAFEIENFPKIKLENKESARLVVLEVPESAFVHNLRAPKIVSGQVQYNGEEMIFEFIGNPICLGDENVVKERTIDVKNCPACKAVQENPDWFQAPKRKYATHVYQYVTNGSNKAPASGEGNVKVWAFADQKFGELIDIFESANEESDEPVDIRDIDLLLGPCENPMYQKYKILPGKSAWKAKPETRSRFESSVEANRCKDLYRYIGRKMGRDFIDDKVADVRRKWNQANNTTGEVANDGLASVERNTLDAGLSSLLEEPKTEVQKPARQEPTANLQDYDDILNNL